MRAQALVRASAAQREQFAANVGEPLGVVCCLGFGVYGLGVRALLGFREQGLYKLPAFLLFVFWWAAVCYSRREYH